MNSKSKPSDGAAPEGKKAYEKPCLQRFGSLQEKTKTVGTPLPGNDLIPYVALFGDPS